MIQIDNLSFGYPGKKTLFQNLQLSLHKGHIYGLLGKNGAGKSTLLKNMVGLGFPTEGRCLVNGQNASSRTVELLQDLYFLPEEIYLPSQTLAKYARTTACFYPRFSDTDFNHYLGEFGVSREEVLPEMSFGQQKKALIAFALATNTSLLVMDEPTNGLDIPSKVQFRRIIASALTEDRCMIISTHQVRDLDSLIDTLVVLHNQEIVLNQELEAIADKLTFTTLSSTQGMDVLYAENSVKGKHVIMPNTAGTYSRVDMELLFNAIINGDKSILTFLNRPVYAKQV
ncbi:ABC transporter ATP-binding protein [Pontibacter akesuensis]|uniref:ABC-2 type transport system ATP-binding protein n=1 Tax=Pontibacter akesuensis TaxID=388950 RepID=A0A1I7KES4_9BACT|nr:ABC transporter ATP-binding protein [Pontibacter akesuensis]GHA79781.1 ABC transporter ATP-binding protein [Pontibacter akesuensis]SFU95880.1 ABC-2 type transport system ATP-binding protein [Pontibacter akesuensis]